MSTFQRRPFQQLEDRIAGLDPRPVLREDVPNGLAPVLRDWLRDVFAQPGGEDAARRTCLRLDVEKDPHPQLGYGFTLYRSTDQDALLIVADAVLQLNERWQDYEWDNRSLVMVKRLDQALMDAGSSFEVNWDRACLTRRVDPTVKASFDQAAGGASAEAGDHLRTAFAEAYGMAPNPDTSYDESVRAVEAAYCPLVLNKQAGQGLATLGTVLGELRKSAKWRLALPDKAGKDTPVDTVVGMIASLWEGQVSRHAGSPHSRRQTQAEAEAAVHLAATLVHWASTGVVFQT